MNIQRKTIMLVFLIFLTPSILFADYKLETGYDLYHYIKLMDNPQNTDDADYAMHTAGYLNGYLDCLGLMQDIFLQGMLPRKLLSEEEMNKFAKELNYRRVNIPKEGIATGQFILVYKKYAEKHPEKLNGTTRICILESLIEAYGWK